MDKVRQITIVGTGLLGSSCGLGLRAAGYSGRIVGVGRRALTVERARELGCIDEAATSLEAPVRGSDLVILATPLSHFAGLLQELAGYDHPGMVVTDVGSTKQQVCAEACRWLPDPTRFVGSHPMAGGEQHGPDAASADLFRGKPCIITPESDTNPEAIRTVEALWAMLEMRVVQMPAEDHDHHVARISHLPHALAVLLLDMVHKQGGLELASTGFRDTTRVASGDADVWLDIFTANRQSLIDAVDAFTGQLADFRELLATTDNEKLMELLRHSKDVRDDWISQL